VSFLLDHFGEFEIRCVLGHDEPVNRLYLLRWVCACMRDVIFFCGGWEHVWMEQMEVNTNSIVVKTVETCERNHMRDTLEGHGDIIHMWFCFVHFFLFFPITCFCTRHVGTRFHCLPELVLCFWSCLFIFPTSPGFCTRGRVPLIVWNVPVITICNIDDLIWAQRAIACLSLFRGRFLQTVC
jgi:hypothetical protein